MAGIIFPVLETSELTFEASETNPFMDTIVGIFPSNFITPLSEATMLQVIVMALLIGFAVSGIQIILSKNLKAIII